MYSIDHLDSVRPLQGIPQSSIGAPLPLILAAEGSLAVAFLLELRDPAWDGTSIHIVDHRTSADPAAILTFRGVHAHILGPPNDEAFEGHPLAERGLKPYGAFEILGSSWIRAMERMNRVHEYHSPAPFQQLRHVVLAFHDSTFEVAAREFSVLTAQGPLLSLLPQMSKLLALADAV